MDKVVKLKDKIYKTWFLFTKFSYSYCIITRKSTFAVQDIHTERAKDLWDYAFMHILFMKWTGLLIHHAWGKGILQHQSFL